MVTLRAWVAKKRAACPAEFAGADHVDVEPVGVRRFAAGGAVGDALADEAVEALDREPAPGDPAGEDDRAGAQHVAAVQVELPAARVDAGDRAGDEDLGAEAARLLQGAAGQLVAGDAGGKAEVVLDPGGGAGLAAGSLALDDDRPQSLGGAVDGGREAGWPGTDDHRVVFGGGGLGVHAEQVRDPAQARPHRGLAVDDADRRPVFGVRQWAFPQLRFVSRLAGDPAEGDLVAVEEAAQLGAGRVPAVADDDRPRRWRIGREPLQALRATHPICREPPDLLGDVRDGGCQRVVGVGIDPHQPRRLGGAESDREDGAEDDRHLAEDVADDPLADHPLDPVGRLDRLDAPVEDGIDRPLVTLLRGELARW
jgi:hypothetical protein